jgi:two-component system chemotaxis response regulator CheY
MLIAKRILVVDDEPVICALAARALREAGYEVVLAADGQVGYGLAKAQPFDLVITDSRMPYLNGRDLVALLRMLSPCLPIIHMSGSHGESSTPGDLPANVLTIYKPFDVGELVKHAQRLLPAA